MSTFGPYPMPFFFVSRSYSGAANRLVPIPVVKLLNFKLSYSYNSLDDTIKGLFVSFLFWWLALNPAARPKSPNLAFLFLSRKILCGLISLWMIPF